MFNTKNTYDVIKKSEVRKVHPAVWQHPVIFGKVHNELCRFKCNFNETPQPSLRELEKMVKEIQVAEVNEEEEKETDQQPDMLQDREQWDLSGDIIDCFRRYSSELSPEEQEEIIKGIEEGLTDQDVKRYFTLVGAEKMRQYRRVLMVAKIRDEDN